MSETPLMRDGKVILRLVDHDDGTVTLKKPLPVKESHIYQQTGAPGWDKRYVDSIFAEHRGTLEYVYGMSKFVIPYDLFISKAYVSKHVIFGEQYHCEVQHYTEEPILPVAQPVRSGGLAVGEVYVEPPKKLEFGMTLRCKRCRGSGVQPGLRTAGSCTECAGHGVIKWQSSTR